MPHAATIDALRMAGQMEALALDPVYSAKGLAGLIALVRVIVIHTGGVPPPFAYESVLAV